MVQGAGLVIHAGIVGTRPGPRHGRDASGSAGRTRWGRSGPLIPSLIQHNPWQLRRLLQQEVGAMYGLVNRAIEQLVVSTGGEAAWQRVCRRAGVAAEGFVAMCPYDDGITYRLVGAVSEELGLAPEQVLEAFGNYWVLYTAEEGYGELMHACGEDLRQFLDNLNELHGRIETIFPGLRPPHFEVQDVAPGEYWLHYGSEREGLAPMVVGLLKGLAKRFGQAVEIEPLTAGDGQAGRFRIRHLDAPAAA